MKKECDSWVLIYLGSNKQEGENSSKRVVMRKNGCKLNIDNGRRKVDIKETLIIIVWEQNNEILSFLRGS